MRYIFWGTPEFAAIILEKLIEAGMPPALVVTNPDKPAGRTQTLTPPQVKVAAESHRIALIQPNMLKNRTSAKGGVLRFPDDPEKPGSTPNYIIANEHYESSRGPTGNRAPETMVSTQVSDHPGPTTDLLYQDWDFFLVVAYGKIIPKSILEIPRLGVLNVHPSLLPKYRGPTPIQTAILNGDKTTGVSIMLLDEEIDHGPLLLQRQLKVVSCKLKVLERKLAELGAEMLIGILPKYIAEKITPVPQNHAKATFTKKFTMEDAFVPYENIVAALQGNEKKTIRIDRMIRALNPEPGAWTKTTDKQILDLPKNKRVKLLEAEIQNGKLILKQVQVEGQKPRIPN